MVIVCCSWFYLLPKAVTAIRNSMATGTIRASVYRHFPSRTLLVVVTAAALGAAAISVISAVSAAVVVISVAVAVVFFLLLKLFL